MPRGSRLSYEVTPGASHFDHTVIRDAPYRIKLKVFNRVKRLFEAELKQFWVLPRASRPRYAADGPERPTQALSSCSTIMPITNHSLIMRRRWD